MRGYFIGDWRIFQSKLAPIDSIFIADWRNLQLKLSPMMGQISPHWRKESGTANLE